MHAFPHEANQQALSWLKSALTETLGEASRALETFSKDTADSSPLQQCLGCLQQIASTLQMLELKDANLLAAEIGALGQSILNHRIKASVPVLEELSQGIIVLQGYLHYLEAGKKGCPLSVLTAINDLRVARGESPQIAVDLFAPDLAAPLPPSLGTAIALEDAAFRSLAAQLRLHYEVALLQWFRDPNGGGLSLLAQVITQLRQHSGSEAPLRLWWLAQGVIEALQEGGLYISQEIKLLLGSLDRYIKILAQEGEPALAASIPATLLKSLLFQVAYATSSGSEVTTIKAAYGLESCSPAEALLTLFAMEATEAVLTNLGEELDQAKDCLDMVVRLPQQRQQNLTTLWNLLHRLAATLEILEFNAPLALLQELLNRLGPQIRNESSLDEAQQRELASALLNIEALLEKNTFLSRVPYGRQKYPSAQAETSPSTRTSNSNVLQTARQAAVKECLGELSAIIHGFTDYSADSQNWVSLAPRIQHLAAILAILDLNPVTLLLLDCRRCLMEKKISPTSPLDRERLITALAALESYLQMIVAGTPANTSLLDMATAQLTQVLRRLDSPVASDELLPAPEEKHASPKAKLTAPFWEEAEDLLQTIQALLSAWRQTPSAKGLVAEIQRKLHTLKGGAHLSGISPLAELAHHMEAMLSNESSNDQPPEAECLELLQCCLNRLWVMYDYAHSGRALPSVTDLLAKMEHCHSSAGTPTQPTPPFGNKQDTSNKEALSFRGPPSHQIPETSPTLPVEKQTPPIEQIRIRADALERLFKYAAAWDQSCHQMEPQIEMLHTNLAETAHVLTHLTAQLHEPAPGTKENPHLDSPLQAAPEARQALRDSLNQLTRFQKILQETVQEVGALLCQQAHLSIQLQQELKNTELLPFAVITPRLQHLVHHTAQAFNKSVQLEISGGTIECKQTLLNQLPVPLEHILRNSICHGIESPVERIAAGKEETGTIHLSLTREDSALLIRISDDGRGIDLEKIRTTALARGLIPAETIPSDTDLMQLILEPGFSTAENVSPLAGRGIGMDIVAHEIQRLNGSLDMAFSKGQETTFTIRLPCL